MIAEFIKLFVCCTAAVMLFSYVNDCHAATKCEPDGRGGVCCWDTQTDGIFKPIACS